MEDDRDKLCLASLLHDIGKFYQRADERNENGSFQFLSRECQNMASSYCPAGRDNDYSHKHVLWTAQFIRENELEKSLNMRGLERLAAAHHNPDPNNILERILQKADHWSSGADRTKNWGTQDSENENQFHNFKKTQMRSILESVLCEEADKYSYQYYLPVRSLELSPQIFPKDEKIDPDYTTLWSSFVSEFRKIKVNNNRNFIETLYHLLHKYTVTIPSSTIHLPDVSLYDHAKTVAAFSICIYDYLKQKNNLSAFKLKNDEEVVLLIGGDISGIQQYIYQIISQQAAKNLKGRSFYLQLLVDSVISLITDSLGLYQANIVYASGGGFYLLAANTEENRKKLTAIDRDISNKIFDEHKTSLYLAIDTVGLSEDDIMGSPNKIGERWKELIEKLNHKKRSRYADQIPSHYTYFFEVAESGARAEKDLITNEEISPSEKPHYVKGGGVIRQSTLDQINLGKYLRQSTALIKSKTELANRNADNYLYYINPLDLNIHWYFAGHENQYYPDHVTLLRLNTTELDRPGGYASHNFISGFTFYGGNNFPTDNNHEPVYFDTLAGEEKNEFRRLGVLRMDVDNLGYAFTNGFAESRRTFSRYTSLSRSLDFFFKGYINTLWNKKEDFRRWTYIVYSGGDDLFIVGRWDVTLQFAEKLRKAFRKWVCGNPNLTLSAGLIIVPPKFPILKAAEMAGEAEEKSKNHRIHTAYVQQEKNAICLLGLPLNWDYEYKIVKKWQKKLAGYVQDKKLPSGFLHKIQTYYQMRKHQENKQLNESWRWILAYDFTRLSRRLKDDDVKNFLSETQHDVICNTYKTKEITSNYHALDLLNLAARWAEIKIRTQKSMYHDTPSA